MKKLILIIAVSILTFNCSDDDNTPNEANSSTIKGTGNYVINNNESPTNYAYWYGGTSLEATFTLTNVKLNSQSEVYNNLSDSVWFDLRPQETETVNAGTYKFSRTEGFPKYIQDGGHNSDEFTGGTVTISQNGTNYKVSYDITLESGKNIKGNYSGAINIVK